MLWNEFLDCARRYALSQTEGDWRSAVSRAYYAIFHLFREWFRSHGLKLGNGAQAHSNLYFGLANSGIVGMQQLAQKIDDLRKDRTGADYDLWRSLSAADAHFGVGTADTITADFQLILQTVPPRQIVDSVKNYLISIGRITP